MRFRRLDDVRNLTGWHLDFATISMLARCNIWEHMPNMPMRTHLRPDDLRPHADEDER